MTGPRSGAYERWSSTRMQFFDKNCFTEGHSGLTRCLIQIPWVVLSQTRSLLPNSFPQLDYDFPVIFLIKSPTLSYPFNHDNTLIIERNDQHCQQFILLRSPIDILFPGHLWASVVLLWAGPSYQTKCSSGFPVSPDWGFSRTFWNALSYG